MKRTQRILIAIGAGLLLFLTLGAWSLSSPVGSSPDDDFHLASIWCGQGERQGLCESGSDQKSRLVPDKILEANCYSTLSNVTARCQGETFLDGGFSLEETDRLNSGTQYPSGYYYVTSFLAGENLAVSTILIRLLNSALFAALILGTFWFLPKRLRFVLVGSVALTFVPLGLFITGSTNPSSWALISGAVIIPAMLGWFHEQGRNRWALGIITLIASALGISARGDSAAYLVVAALAVSVLAFQNRREYWIRAILPAAIVIMAVIAFLSAGQSSLALGGEMSSATEENSTSKIALAVINLLALPNLWGGIFGLGWGLGWFDTALSPAVSFTTLFLVSGVLFAAFRSINWRRGVALAGIGSAAVIVPIYILVQSYALVGQEVQPRYIMPLITMFVAAALAPSATNESERWQEGTTLSKLQIWMIALGLAGAQALALFDNLRRNVTAASYNLNVAQDWWWTAGPSPFAILAIGAFAGLALMVVFAIVSTHSTSSPKDPVPAVTRTN